MAGKHVLVGITSAYPYFIDSGESTVLEERLRILSKISYDKFEILELGEEDDEIVLRKDSSIFRERFKYLVSKEGA